MLIMTRKRRVHGHSYFAGKKQQSKTYSIWMCMKRRCTCPSFDSYPNYGGRGIKVCERWNSFENFLLDMGICPENHSIERLDCNGDYSPENCTWIPAKDQALNRRNSRVVDVGGKLMLMTHAARLAGIDVSSMADRIDRGVTGADLLKKPRKWKLISINGEEKTAKEWAKIHGVGYAALRFRMKKGLPQSEWFKV